MERLNWSGSYAYTAPEVREPRTLDELQEVVAGARQVHALGSRHSFNAVADTRGTQVALSALPTSVEVDPEGQTATVSGLLTYGDVAVALERHGLALRNLASLPHISVAGACATGTHGSGDANQTLAAAVRAIEMVTAAGDLVRLDRDGTADFPGSVVALGALGVVTSVTLDVVPTFRAHQRVYLDLPASTLHERFDDVMSAAYSVSCFTRWRDRTVDMVWVKSVGDPADDPERLHGARRASVEMHPVPAMAADNATPQQGATGPWYERLPHFRIGFVPSNGAEIQSEYFVPRSRAVEAVEAMWGIGERLHPLLQISEIRSVAADDLWLSPAYGEDVVGLHFTWHRDAEALARVLPLLEETLAPFGATPHWGKAFVADRSVFERRYGRLGDFAALAARLDPERKLVNPFLEANVL